MAAHSIKEYIYYYKNKLERCKDDEDMVIETIQKLGKPTTVSAEVVQETGVLRNLYKLCKEKGRVAEIARALFNKWKHLPSARDKKPPEEQANAQVKAPPRELDLPAWSHHVASDPAIHPAHRCSNQDITHPERGSTKRKDPFPPAAEPKRLNSTHHSNREVKHTTPQKDHPATDARSHRSTNHHDIILDRPRHSATKKEFVPPDGDSARHLTSKRHLFPPDGEAFRHSALKKKDIFATDGSSSALDGYSSSAPDGYSKHPTTRGGGFALEDHSASASDGYSRHPPAKNDIFAADGHISRHPTARKDHFIPDGESSRHTMTKKDIFASDFESSRHSTSKQDNFAPLVDSARHSSSRKDHFAVDSDSSRHFMPKKDSFGDGETSTHTTRKDHFHDGDSSRHLIAKKDNFTAEGNSFHGNRDLVRMETTSHHNQGSRYSSTQRDAFPSETDGAVGGFNRDDETRHLKKDYFPPGVDATEQNGVSSSQENNHHLDIDSLSNPNLNIDTGLLNTSDDSENASPTKRARTLEPYYIEMREGMFRAIKNPKGPLVNDEGLRFYEMIHRDIMKNSAFKRDRVEKGDEKDRNNSTFTMSPRDASGDCEKWNAKNGPSDPKMNAEKSVRAKTEPKRKSDSPCKGKDKKMCPDSTLDHKFKIKKEVLSPSHLPKAANHVEGHQSNCDRNKSAKIQDSPETSAMQYMSSSKKERRVVYSGRKAVQEISSLKNLCLQVLKKNLDHLRCPKKVPYQSLQPLLETLNPSQLSKVEEHNRFLSTYTNSLWKLHYNRDHRSQVVVKNPNDIVWKDEYNRAQEIKRKKLRNITAGINAAASKAKPDRQAKVIETQIDFGRRGARNAEVPISSSKSAVPTPSPVVGSRSSSSPTSKVASTNPKTLPPVNSKPKETKHLVAHKPVKKVVAPLMSKVKKSMAIVYSRQK